MICIKGLGVALAGVFAATAGAAFGAGVPLKPSEIIEFVNNGERGMSALWMVMVVLPLVASTTWVIGKLLSMLNHQAESHRLERQEAMKEERKERSDRWLEVNTFFASQTAALVENTKSLQQVCSNLEKRPCVANGHLLQEEQ